jgi:gliding motility-associated-like protein
LCNGGNDGAISTITQGGTAPYSYSWSTGATSASIVNLQAGTYSLLVTDANGCQTNASFQVTQPAQPILLTETHTAVSCNGGNNGAIDLSVSGGTTPYSFAWSNGASSEDVTGLLAGTYAINVTDANGCTENISVNISQPSPLSYSGTVSNVLCFGGTTGSINGTTTGGTSPYTYAWSNGQTTEDLVGLAAGNYSITTTDANGCSIINNFTITQPFLPVQVSATQVNVSCAGGNNASIDVSVSNGTAPYSFLWNNSATTEDLTNLTSGTYSVDITDANGCSAQLSIIITEPSNPISLSATQLNVPCFGQSTGSIDLNVIGGTAPFTYAWSNGQTTEDIVGLAAGSYSVSVTDTNGCTATTSLTISQPNAALTLTETHQDALCLSTQTGAIDLSVSGGTPGFIYQWNNGTTTEDLTGLNAGSYSVTVTDANACTQSLTISISDPANTLTLSETHQNVTCFGGLSGSIDLTISNPNPITSIAWSNGAGSEDIAGLAAGNYFVNVTDLNGCSSFLAVAITQPSAPLTVNASVANVACFGQTNGGINLTVTGGTAPYSFSWTNGSTNEDIGNLAAGNYSVLITDANGCTTNFNTTITEPASPITASSIQTPVSCFGGNNGSIDLSVSGGVAPYSYSWNNGLTTQDLTNQPAGNYSVVIQDASGCNLTINTSISQPLLPLANTALVSNVNCAGNNTGTINLTVTGGTAPYSFVWNNGTTTEDLINANAGVYSVSITDINGCTSTGNYQITQPSTQLSAAISVTNVICHNGATGTATVTPSGGTAPYVYAWSNGQNTPFIDSLLAGNISVTVTDAAGCNAVLNGFISQPAPVVANTTNTNNVCYGQSAGNISVVANGGVAPYSYLWNTGSTLTFINNLPAGPYFVQITDGNGCTTTFSDTVYQPANSINVASTVVDNICFGQADGAIDITISGGSAPYQHLWNTGIVTEDLTNLLAGQYTVTVVDNNGCLLMQTIAVNQPAGPIIITGVVTPASCFATNTGAINVSVTGPNSPFTYLWSNGSTTEDINNLTAGNYSLTVTNANGCTASASYVITEPLPLSASATLQQVSCFNASNGGINLTVSGGTGPYSFSWTTGQTTEDLTNIPSGTYSVTITDANGCFTSYSYTINQPSTYSVNLTPQNVLCFAGNSGQIFSTVTGGTAPYTYLWNSGANTPNLTGLTAGNYTLTVYDNNGCSTSANTTLSQPAFATTLTAVVTNEACANTPTGAINLTVNSPTPGFTYFWNNGAATEDLTAITANLYAVTVTDNNGCVTTASFQVNAATPIYASAIITAVDCFDNATGAINLSVSGATPNYSFNWSNGATSEDINSLIAGVYFVTITDQNNCSQGFSFNVTQPSDSINLIGLMIPVSCAGGSNGGIDLSVTGGTPNYAYSWSNNTFGQDLVNVPAGNYSITVTDFNGCSKTEVFNVAQPIALGIVANITPVTCFGGNNGSIDLTPTGGIENYTINWSNGETTEDITNLTANNYQVNITDNNGCTFDSILSITQPLSLTSLSLVATNVSCFGANNGAIDLTIAGGTQPYTINWNNGQITEDIQNLIGGTYTVTVVDSNGCTATASMNINAPLAPLSLTATTQNVTCFNGSNGQINLTPNGGTAPYTYAWSNSATSQDLINVVAGNYSVVVTDDQGCTSNGSYALTQPASGITITNNITPVSCFDGNNGAINLTINGGIQPYTISWSSGQTTEDISSLLAGNYTVTVSDAAGCSLNPTFTVSQPFAPLSITANLNTISCFGGSNGAIDITTSGGTQPYTYIWSNNSSSEDIQTLSEGSYSLIVTDANGCQLDSTLAVTQPLALSASSLNTNVLCHGNATGAINLSVVGGVFPYDFAWSNGDISEDISAITAGTYSVVITDANGCVLNFTTTISQPAQPLIVTETHQNVLCFGANNGSINLTVTGATPSYSYLWNTGATTQDIATLIAGTYTATITDANNCVLLFPVTITQPSAPLTLQNTITNVQCTGDASGAIDITVLGGTSPFTYYWNTGATSQDLVGVPVGQYTLAVTDANNCVTSNIFVITQPASALSANFNATNATCFGLANGSIIVSAAGGTVPYTITWPDGSTGNSQSNLLAGNYPIQVTDANGCQVNLQAIITQPEEIITDFSFDVSSGCAPLTVTFTNTSQGNGTSCLWNFGNGITDTNCGTTTYTFQNEGCFNITLTNTASNGCFGSLTIDSAICVTSGPSADFNAIPAADVYYSGDVNFNNLSFGASQYTWIFGDGTPFNTEFSPTHSYPVQLASTYEVMLIAADSNGCIDTATQIININEDFSVYIPNTITIDDNGINEAFLPIFTDYSQIKKYKLVIYNRWGELIWQTTDYNEPWDGRALGKNCQDGVYTWKIIYEDVKLGNRILVGHVTLLR